MVTSATLIKDFYITFTKKELSEKTKLAHARVFTFLIGFGGLILAYLIPSIIHLTLGGFFTLMILAPSVLGGFFWKRANAKASFWSVLPGFTLTLFLLPSLPKTAFIPSFILSLSIFIVLSFISSHSVTEQLELA